MLQINYQKLWKIFLFSKLLITKRKNEKYRKMVICLTWGDFRPPIPFLIFFKLWYSWSAQNSTLESAIAVNFRYYRPTLTYKEGTNLDMVPPSEKRRQSKKRCCTPSEKNGRLAPPPTNVIRWLLKPLICYSVFVYCGIQFDIVLVYYNWEIQFCITLGYYVDVIYNG